MNTVLLNTISLDDGKIIKKGGSGGGVTIKNQTKSVTIEENGNTVVSYDSGYTGLEKVSVKVAIPNEEKTVEITENGTTEVVAENGFLSKVSVNVNVLTSGGGEAPSYKNGVYVQHIDRKLYTEEEWAAAGFANDAANGVAVVTDNARFVIAKNDLGTMAWSSDTSTAIDGIMLESDVATAKTDFAGYNNTQLMLATDTSGAGYSCANFTFPNGAKGYLPALGEMNEAYANKSKINSLMTKIGGKGFLSNIYWSSTQCSSDKAWGWAWSFGSPSPSIKLTTNFYVRAFTSLDLPSSDVPSSGGRPTWTGHADAEGLRAIGWTDEDIAYYQEYGVNWNEEDDQYHLVSDDNKALYGVLTASNISTYKSRIVYLPKIDTSHLTQMNSLFSGCFAMVAIPYIETSNVTSMNATFMNCRSLRMISKINTSSVTSMKQTFFNCSSLFFLHHIDVSKVTTFESVFSSCGSLRYISFSSIPNATSLSGAFNGCSSLIQMKLSNTEGVTSWYQTFNGCYSLRNISSIDITSTSNNTQTFQNCYSLESLSCRTVDNCTLSQSSLLSKESLLYIINNEAATSAITIKLASYAYTRLAEDADVVVALAAHPNISISQ